MSRLVIVLVIALIAAAGCGLDGQKTSHPIPGSDVPFDLLADPTTTVPPPATTTTLAWRANLWFVEGDHLRPTTRQLRSQPRIGAVLRLLLAGPTGHDPASLRSALFVGDATAVASPAGGTLIVDLAEDFGSRPSAEQIVALGQLVFTATEVPGIGRIIFRLDGVDLAVPLPDGQLAQGSVSRDDFAPLVFPA